VASLALGADFTLIGRAYLFGLMAGGREGVDRTIEILGEQVERTMRLLQVADVSELNPAHVTQLRQFNRDDRAEIIGSRPPEAEPRGERPANRSAGVGGS